jgi:protein-L-isoaspartate(D-aspartate) O-methyltransferase
MFRAVDPALGPPPGARLDWCHEQRDISAQRAGNWLRSRCLTVGIVAVGAWLSVAAVAHAQSEESYALARYLMVERDIVREGVKNPAVITAVRTVPRHLFVTKQYRTGAYFDQALPIGHQQTISAPFIVAYMTETLDPQPTDRVLEIGTGSGYQAAVLSGLVKDVYTIEIVEALGKNAARVLKDLKYNNVHPRIGDGYQGWPEKAPFDKIIVTCSPESVPQPLIDQLREGGKMIIPLGERYEQIFYMFEKRNGKLVKTQLLPTLFVPMTGVAEENRHVKPDPKRPEIHNGGFESHDANFRPVGWHYQRQLVLETGNAPEGESFVTFRNRDAGRSAQMLQAMVLDGQLISTIQISLQVRGSNIRNGEGTEQAAIFLQYYDSDRRPMPVEMIGPWEGTFEWTAVSKTIVVPEKAREAILRVGLNGAVGRLSVDDVRLAAQPK